jgi:hypothetical protein
MDESTEFDQMSGGLNFVTVRPRTDIMKDFVHILETTYDPKAYYRRLTKTALNLRPGKNYSPGIVETLRMIKAYLKLCAKVGFNKRTGLMYWKMFFTVLLKNPRAMESALSMAAIFIHLDKQSRFIINLTNDKIADIQRCGEENYNRSMFQLSVRS